VPGCFPSVKMYFVLCLVKKFWFLWIHLYHFAWIVRVNLSELFSQTFGIFFECVLDISLSLCRCILVPLSYISLTGLALIFYIFVSLIEHRRWINWVVFSVEQLRDRANAIWLSSRSWEQLGIRWAQASFQLFCSWFVNCELKHLFSSFALIWLWNQPRIGRAPLALI
jgi:phage shock protein PspC (stress-responsive transcriptional regulator)